MSYMLQEAHFPQSFSDTFGFPEQILKNAVVSGFYAKRRCIGNYPDNAAGFYAWSETFRTFADLTAPYGYKKANGYNVINDDRGVIFGVRTGDYATGTDMLPRIKNKERASFKKFVEANTYIQANYSLFPNSVESENKSLLLPEAWILLYYYDANKKEIRYELSRPFKIDSGADSILRWGPRYCALPVSLSDIEKEKTLDFNQTKQSDTSEFNLSLKQSGSKSS